MVKNSCDLFAISFTQVTVTAVSLMVLGERSKKVTWPSMWTAVQLCLHRLQSWEHGPICGTWNHQISLICNWDTIWCSIMRWLWINHNDHLIANYYGIIIVEDDIFLGEYWSITITKEFSQEISTLKFDGLSPVSVAGRCSWGRWLSFNMILISYYWNQHESPIILIILTFSINEQVRQMDTRWAPNHLELGL